MGRRLGYSSLPCFIKDIPVEILWSTREIEIETKTARATRSRSYEIKSRATEHRALTGVSIFNFITRHHVPDLTVNADTLQSNQRPARKGTYSCCLANRFSISLFTDKVLPAMLGREGQLIYTKQAIRQSQSLRRSTYYSRLLGKRCLLFPLEETKSYSCKVNLQSRLEPRPNC